MNKKEYRYFKDNSWYYFIPSGLIKKDYVSTAISLLSSSNKGYWCRGNHLSRILSIVSGISVQEYYNTYILGGEVPKCPQCGNRLTFNTLQREYRTFCSISCSVKYRNRNPNKKLKNKTIKKVIRDSSKKDVPWYLQY